MAKAAAAGTASYAMLVALQPVAGHRGTERHGSKGPVERGKPDDAAERIEVQVGKVLRVVLLNRVRRAWCMIYA